MRKPVKEIENVLQRHDYSINTIIVEGLHDLPGRSGRLLPHNPHRPGRADFPHPVPLIMVSLNVGVHYSWQWKWKMLEKIVERVPVSFPFS